MQLKISLLGGMVPKSLVFRFPQVIAVVASILLQTGV